jgi:hypothetical protein
MGDPRDLVFSDFTLRAFDTRCFQIYDRAKGVERPTSVNTSSASARRKLLELSVVAIEELRIVFNGVEVAVPKLVFASRHHAANGNKPQISNRSRG